MFLFNVVIFGVCVVDNLGDLVFVVGTVVVVADNLIDLFNG